MRKTSLDRWCQCLNLIIHVDKTSSLGIKKDTTRFVQYLPKLYPNSMLKPRVQIGESFRFLGRYFDFDTSGENYKGKL